MSNPDNNKHEETPIFEENSNVLDKDSLADAMETLALKEDHSESTSESNIPNEIHTQAEQSISPQVETQRIKHQGTVIEGDIISDETLENIEERPSTQLLKTNDKIESTEEPTNSLDTVEINISEPVETTKELLDTTSDDSLNKIDGIAEEEIEYEEIKEDDSVHVTQDPKGSESTSPTASGVVAQQIFDLIGHEDVLDVSLLQLEIMEKIKQSNSTLTEFNNFSQSSYNNIVKDFNGHTRMIKDMKKDLDYIFKKIRSLKQKIYEHCPSAKFASS